MKLYKCTKNKKVKNNIDCIDCWKQQPASEFPRSRVECVHLNIDGLTKEEIQQNYTVKPSLPKKRSQPRKKAK